MDAEILVRSEEIHVPVGIIKQDVSSAHGQEETEAQGEAEWILLRPGRIAGIEKIHVIPAPQENHFIEGVFKPQVHVVHGEAVVRVQSAGIQGVFIADTVPVSRAILSH